MENPPSHSVGPDDSGVLSRLHNVLARLGCPEQSIDSTATKLAESAIKRSFEEKQFLFRESAHNPDLLIIYSGKVALEMNVPGRGRIRILTLGEGDIVAWSALLSGGLMTTSAIAIEPTELIALPAQHLLELSDADHELGYRMMKALALAIGNRLVTTRLQLLDPFANSSATSP